VTAELDHFFEACRSTPAQKITPLMIPEVHMRNDMPAPAPMSPARTRAAAVCDSGPYRIVRHPGYAGNILSLPGIIMALGSMWTLIPAVAALVIAVIRTTLEDRTLQEELPGYRDYARRVRYRLFPGIY
jgi:protein-S-isoprenylcysteine O-methyltransferase Ste14